jgi:hypothetical protein
MTRVDWSVPPCYAARATLATMDDTDFATRLLGARDRLVALRPRVDAGAPWPLSDDYGAAPESTWGPLELLAHAEEMLPYWMREIDRILAGGDGPTPFGRIATDANRIDTIGRDRNLPTAELYARIDRDATTAAERFRSFGTTEWSALGLHPARGEMSVAAIAENMIVGHLEGHVDQLESILAAAGR